MEKRKSAKFLFEMSHDEAREVIERKKNDKDSLVSQTQFGRLARHCLDCEDCERKAKEAGLLISRES